MVDVVLDLSSFFNDSDRGQYMTGPYDAGYGIGMLIFYLVADETSSSILPTLSLFRTLN